MRATEHLPRLGFFVLLLLCATSGGPLRADFDANGWIVDWLVYGPLSQDTTAAADGLGAAPGVNRLRADYISDGDTIFEATMLPEDGDEMTPDFLGASAALGFHPVLTATPAKWQAVNTVTLATPNFLNTVDCLQLYAPGGAVDSAVVYGVVYVENPAATSVDVQVQLASDDSVQVKIDDCEVAAINGGRGYGGTSEEVQNSIPVTLSPGKHRVLVKTFNGNGGYGFRLRFADPAGNPVTNLTTPALNVSLDPAGVPAPVPFGVGVVRSSIIPDKVVGIDKVSTVTLQGVKTFPDLPDGTQVTIVETLPPDISLAPGSATPAPVVSGRDLTWQMTIADLAASGITYGLKYDRAVSGCVTGTCSVEGLAGCRLSITGASCVFVVAANAIFLGDIVGGGSGLGDKAPDIWAINTDTGLFMTEAEVRGANGNTVDTDGINPSPVEEPADPPEQYDRVNPDAIDFVDSVFFMNTPTMAISTAGVQYTFQPNDAFGNSWNHILSNITNDIDKGAGNMRVGGVEGYATGLGIHASSGVTFDLGALRAKYGADKIVNLVTVAGTDGCGGGAAGNNTIRLYIIYSTEDAILEAESWMQAFTGSDQAVTYEERIPDDATFITFATGSYDNGVGCDHGVFAECRIFPELPTARFTADKKAGGPPLLVNFDASTSTPPAGKTITAYDWDFGDGERGTGSTVAHTFQTEGRYTVALTVTDSGGITDSTSMEIQALFTSGDVSPWTSADVGDPYTIGGARNEGGCLVVFGGGKGPILAADEMRFVYQAKSGDQTLDARMEALLFEPTGRAGLMARASLDPDSAMAFVNVMQTITGLRGTLHYRAAKGDSVKTANKNLTFTAPNLRLRLERLGNVCAGYASGDGTTWEKIGEVTMVAPPAELLYGPAVTSLDARDTGATATATFCDVQFGGSGGGGTKFVRGNANADGTLNITDGIYILNFLFLGGPAPPCAESANANGDGTLNITDGIYVLNFLFLGGPAPPAPYPDCAELAPETDCASFPPCNP